MTNSARLSGRPSSSAAYNVGDVVDTPDSAIKSWRYLGAGEWEPNDVVRHTTGPGGGVEKFTVSGIRRADGTVAPVLDTGDGWELLNGWHPRQLFEDGTPGEIFDNRSALMYSSVSPTNVIATEGSAVMVRSGLLSGGTIRPAQNAILYSDQFSNWTAVSASVVASADEWTIIGNSGASSYVNIAMTRAPGDHGTWAVEARLESERWLFFGPGGGGVWFSLNESGSVLGSSISSYVGQVVPSSRPGYVWCVVYMPALQTSGTATGFRIYTATSAPSGNQSHNATNDGVGGVTITRAFYSRTKTGFAESDYNRTHATLPEWVDSGSYCVQLVAGSRPVKQGRRLLFEGGKTMDAVFSTAPGVGSTVARAAASGVVTIDTDQTVGGTLVLSESDIALVVIGRALSSSERVSLRDWLALRVLEAA